MARLIRTMKPAGKICTYIINMFVILEHSLYTKKKGEKSQPKVKTLSREDDFDLFSNLLIQTFTIFVRSSQAKSFL